MGRSRSPKTALIKILTEASVPVYMLDEGGTIAFVNAACARWLGVGEHELCGVTCKYAAHVDALPRLSALAAGLAPPPAPFAERVPFRALVAGTAAGETCERRSAWFVPLAQAAAQGSKPRSMWLVFVGSEPAELVGSEAPSLAEAEALHDCLRALGAGRFGLGSLVGKSPQLARVRRQIELAVRGESGALIQGPPGSGREHVARTIHYAQERAAGGGLLLPLECPLQSAELMQGALVAFARRCRELKTGRGALLLIEVDRLPLDAQLELEAWHDLPHQDIRLFGTATGALGSGPASPAFRPALAARLSTLVIELPSLGQRREDIPLLAQHFIERENLRSARQLSGLTPEACERLQGFSWPGEVQQLADMVAQAAGRSAGPWVTVADLPWSLSQAAAAEKYAPPPVESLVLDEFLAGVETELLRRALRQARGNKSRAAELLGISRPRLLRRLAQLGLATPSETATDEDLPIFEEA